MTILFERATPTPSGYREIAPASVAAARGTVRIVDVREPAEYTGELGHIPGSELVPLATVESTARERNWDRTQEIVLVCRSGARSGRAAAALAAMGFERVVNMTGGMIAYGQAALPIERA